MIETAPRAIPVPNNYDGPFPQGVPSPFGPRVHPYPTRFHGPIYTRPEFGLPWHERSSNNEAALPASMQGFGETEPRSGMTIIVAFLVGAALGAAIGYQLGKQEQPSRAIVFR